MVIVFHFGSHWCFAFLPCPQWHRFWTEQELAAPNTAITPRSIVLSEFVWLNLSHYLIVFLFFSFRVHASVQLANEPRKGGRRWQLPCRCIQVTASGSWMVEDPTASVPEETPSVRNIFYFFFKHRSDQFMLDYIHNILCIMCVFLKEQTHFNTVLHVTQTSKSTSFRFDCTTTTEGERRENNCSSFYFYGGFYAFFRLHVFIFWDDLLLRLSNMPTSFIRWELIDCCR